MKSTHHIILFALVIFRGVFFPDFSHEILSVYVIVGFFPLAFGIFYGIISSNNTQNSIRLFFIVSGYLLICNLMAVIVYALKTSPSYLPESLYIFYISLFWQFVVFGFFAALSSVVNRARYNQALKAQPSAAGTPQSGAP